MATIQDSLNKLTSATTQLINEVNVKKTTLDTVITDAETAVGVLVTQAETAEGNASTSASAASSSASSAAANAALLGDYVSMTSLERALPTKAEFEALAEERKTSRVGSGFDEWGRHAVPGTFPNVNEGMWTRADIANVLMLGYAGTNYGTSKTTNPFLSVNGTHLRINGVYSDGNNYPSQILMPTAPTITHADSSNSGMLLNGRDFVDTAGWTAGTNTLSVENSELVVTIGTNWARSSQLFTGLVVGQKYTIEFEAYKDAGNIGGNIDIYESSAGTPVNDGTDVRQPLTTTPTRYQFEITAEFTYYYFNITGYAGDVIRVKNAMVCPSSELSRSDLVFLETWHEDVSEKDFVYPLGNIQYLGADTDGLTGIVAGAFTGKETYSLFGNWQASNALVGKGYVWSTMSEADKIKFVSNPENNCYIDGDMILQVRYRVRVVQGHTDKIGTGIKTATKSHQSVMVYDDDVNSNFMIKPKGKLVSITKDLANKYSDINSKYTMESFVHTYGNDGVFISGLGGNQTIATNFATGSRPSYAIPIALVHRRNQGAYHPKFNPNGTSSTWDATENNNSRAWYHINAKNPKSISNCFSFGLSFVAGNLEPFTDPRYGKIGSTSFRPDGLFYDEVNERDVIDLRNSSHKVQDYKRLLEREFNKAVTGDVRGEEGEYELVPFVRYTGITGASGGTSYVTFAGSSYAFADGTNRMYWKDAYKQGQNGMFIKFDTTGNVYTLQNVFNHSTLLLLENIVYCKPIQSGILSETGNATLYAPIQKSSKKSNTTLHCDIIGNPANYYRGQTYIDSGTKDVALGNVVWAKTATGGGTAGNFYKALAAQTSIDLSVEDYSNALDYTTTGATQVVSVNVGDIVFFNVASSSTGVGVLTHYFKAKVAQASIDLDLEDFTNTTNWTDLGTDYILWEDLGSDWDGAGSWRTGVSGTPLMVGENSENYIDVGSVEVKLTKKATAIKLVLQSTDSGVTWNTIGYTLDAVKNSLVLYTNSMLMVFYETPTAMAKYTTQTQEILSYGFGAMGNNNNKGYGSYLANSMFDKVMIGGASSVRFTPLDTAVITVGEFKDFSTYRPKMTNNYDGMNANNTYPSWKIMPYLTKQYNKTYLHIIFKEISYNAGWGDDGSFAIVDNIAKEIDDNGDIVLVGQKRIELPYFIEDKE